MEDSGISNRRSPRRVFDSPVGVLHNGKYRLRLATHLSEGGMMVILDDSYKVKDLVLMTILLPAGGHAIVRAELLYSADLPDGKKGFGMRFQGLQLAQRRLIRNYISAKTQAEAELENRA
jgi:hypothetical protein